MRFCGIKVKEYVTLVHEKHDSVRGQRPFGFVFIEYLYRRLVVVTKVCHDAIRADKRFRRVCTTNAQVCTVCDWQSKAEVAFKPVDIAWFCWSGCDSLQQVSVSIAFFSLIVCHFKDRDGIRRHLSTNFVIKSFCLSPVDGRFVRLTRRQQIVVIAILSATCSTVTLFSA